MDDLQFIEVDVYVITNLGTKLLSVRLAKDKDLSFERSNALNLQDPSIVTLTNPSEPDFVSLIEREPKFTKELLAKEIVVLNNTMKYMKTVFDKILNQMNSVDDLITELMVTTAAVIGVDDFFVFLVDPESRTDLAQGYYFSKKYFDQKDQSNVIILDTDLNLALMKWVIITSTPFSFIETSSNPNIEDPNTHLCIPIKDIINDLFGMVYVISNQDVKVDNNETFRLLSMFADLIGSGTYHLSILKNVFPSYEVASEMLTYHMSPKKQLHETVAQTLKKYQKKKKIKTYFNDINFDAWGLTADKSLGLVYMGFMYMDLFSEFKIDHNSFTHWILTVRNCYRDIPFHNWEHAVSVFQTCVYILSTSLMPTIMSSHEKLGIMIACICHHLDHRATDNTFLLLSNSALTRLYSKSFLEEHHIFWCLKILSMPGNNILKALPQKTYKEFVIFVEECILATNASSIHAIMRLKNLPSQLERMKQDTNIRWETFTSRSLLHKVIIPVCDMNGFGKTWKMHIKYTVKMYEEYFLQANLEKVRGMMGNSDRSMYLKLPQNQMEFIENYCLFLFQTLSDFCPALKDMLLNCQKNQKRWSDMTVKLVYKFFLKHFFLYDKEKQNKLKTWL